MRNILFLLAVFILLAAPGAYAFSVESSSTPDSRDTSNFSDPDEQMPAGLVSPSAGTGMHLSGSSSVTSSVNAPTIQQMNGMNQSQSSFDSAYGHVTNSR